MPVPVMAVAALAQLGLAGYQMYKGAKAEKEAGEQPDYQIPKEMEQSLSLAQRQAFEGLPAEQKQQYVENLRSAQATGLAQLSERKSGLAGVSQMQQSATEGYRNLLSMDAAARQQNIQRYQQQLETMAGYQDLAYQTNELQPWQRQVEYGRAQQGAALQNAFGAIGGMAQAYAYGQGLGQGTQQTTNADADIAQYKAVTPEQFYGGKTPPVTTQPLAQQTAPVVNTVPNQYNVGSGSAVYGFGGGGLDPSLLPQQPQQYIIN
jgi:hypothetical protein